MPNAATPYPSPAETLRVACFSVGVRRYRYANTNAVAPLRGFQKSNMNPIDVLQFYESLGFKIDDVISLGKRL
ncbi:hypothetical protein [Nostoc sp. T09]|uniref:hypothetical protein n=1 Tax=Nostoc sp. T09 TaxID=1932621 RepID=UPI00117E7A33|nr:hypothetical protein [Nostoc sp. T09]